MTDPADAPAYRHPTVYRTVRGLSLSGGRSLAGAGAAAAAAEASAPVRRVEIMPVRPATELAGRGLAAAAAQPYESVQGEAGVDDATGLYDARRYSEPND